MLKSFALYFMTLLLAALVACSAVGLPTPTTFNERLATAQSSVTSLRATATSLLNAKKISSADATNVLKQTDAATEGIALAMLVHKTDPSAGDSKLQTAVSVLSVLQAYLVSKQ